MMFDTLSAARTLKDAGMTSEQAEAVTATIRVAIGEGTTKKNDISRLEAKLAELELRLAWRILGGVGALLAAAVTVARLLFAAP